MANVIPDILFKSDQADWKETHYFCPCLMIWSFFALCIGTRVLILHLVYANLSNTLFFFFFFASKLRQHTLYLKRLKFLTNSSRLMLLSHGPRCGGTLFDGSLFLLTKLYV